MSMGKTRDLGVVEELARRFQAGEIESAFELYHPNVHIEQPASLPHGGIHVGRDGIRAMGATFAQFWSRTISDPRRLRCEGGGVVQFTSQTWTAKSTQRSASVDVVELFSFAEGLISAIRVFQHDTHRLLATLDHRSDALPANNWRRTEDLRVVDASLVERLVQHWEDGWNREDVDTIVAPFASDVVFSSPFVSRITGDPSLSTIRGLPAVRQYVADSFVRATRGIRYTAEASYAGTDTVVLHYTVHHPKSGDRSGADTMRLDADGKVVEWRCQYRFDR